MSAERVAGLGIGDLDPRRWPARGEMPVEEIQRWCGLASLAQLQARRAELERLDEKRYGCSGGESRRGSVEGPDEFELGAIRAELRDRAAGA